MQLSNKISDNEIYLFLKDFIKHLQSSHRKTHWYQIETEKFDDFGKMKIIDYLTKNEEERFYLEEQLDFINTTNSTWNKDYFNDTIEIDFISSAEARRSKLTHFRFSVPLITMNKDLLIMKVVYQNAYTENNLNGSDCIELFKILNPKKWEYIGHLYGTSI